jgi:hypothetical protein
MMQEHALLTRDVPYVAIHDEAKGLVVALTDGPRAWTLGDRLSTRIVTVAIDWTLVVTVSVSTMVCKVAVDMVSESVLTVVVCRFVASVEISVSVIQFWCLLSCYRPRKWFELMLLLWPSGSMLCRTLSADLVDGSGRRNALQDCLAWATFRNLAKS